jgi:hypothetical protein
MTTTIDQPLVEKYADLVAMSSSAAAAVGAGRLLHEVTEHEPTLRDALSSVMCLLVDNHWGKDNELADAIVKGFTYPDLMAAANRHEDRNPRDDDDQVTLAAV